MATMQHSGFAPAFRNRSQPSTNEQTQTPSVTASRFIEAAEQWFALNSIRWRIRVRAEKQAHIKALSVFFGRMRLQDIHIGPIMQYQRARGTNDGTGWFESSDAAVTPWVNPCGPSLLNHEVSTLQSILKHAGLWGPIAPLYKPMPMPAWQPPKVMSDSEKQRFFAVAASKPDFRLALWVTTISEYTSAAGTELRHLQLRDVILEGNDPRIVVNGDTAKNNYRGRTISLLPVAQEAVRACLERAVGLGSFKPEHYLFPLRDDKTRKFDPTRPATDSWLRRSWDRLRDAAGLPWLTPHCLRHQCITELGEKGVAPEMIRQIAGHVSAKMMQHYSHRRHEQQAAALSVLAPQKPQPKARRPNSLNANPQRPAKRSAGAFSLRRFRRAFGYTTQETARA